MIALWLYVLTSAPATLCAPTPEIWSKNCLDHLPTVEVPKEYWGFYAPIQELCKSDRNIRYITGSNLGIVRNKSLRPIRVVKIDDATTLVEARDNFDLLSSPDAIRVYLKLKKNGVLVSADEQKNFSDWVKCS